MGCPGEAQLKLERMQQKAEQEQARLEAQKKAEKAGLALCRWRFLVGCRHRSAPRSCGRRPRRRAKVTGRLESAEAKKKAEAKLLKLKAKQEKSGSPKFLTGLRVA